MADMPDREPHREAASADRVNEAGRRRAAERTRRTRRLLAASTGGPRPPLGLLGVVILLVVAAWLAIGAGYLYPEETRAGPLRDGSMAVVLALVALWAALMPEGKRVAACIALLLGLGLLAIGIFETTTATLHGQHVVTGVLAVIGALLCLLSPQETRA